MNTLYVADVSASKTGHVIYSDAYILVSTKLY